MVALIGYIVGAYVLVKLVEIMTSKQTHEATMIFALGAFSLVIYCLMLLFLADGKAALEGMGRLKIPS